MRIIVCGADKIGSVVVDFLHKMGHAVTVIDKNEAAISKIKGKTTAYCTVGNALYFEVLSRCGIAEADVVLALTGDDAVNIAICQIAYSFFGVRIKVARIKNDILFYTKAMPYSFAPDFMFLPELILAQAMYNMLIYAKGVVKMPLMNDEIRLYTFAVHESGFGSIAKFNEKMSADGGVVALVAHRNGTISIAAEMLNYEIVSGDILLIVSKGLSFVQLDEVRDLSSSPSDALLLVGKLEIVLIMLKFLTNKKQNLKRPIVVLAENATEAQRIATEFSAVWVVTGNIFDQDTIAGINAHTIGIALVATDDDVKNVMISAYFKKYIYSKPVVITTNSLFKDDFLDDLKIDMRVDTEREIREFFSYVIEKAFSREVRRSILSGVDLFELKVVTDGVFVFKDISVLVKQRNLLDFAIVYRNGTIKVAKQDFILNPGDFVVGFSSNT